MIFEVNFLKKYCYLWFLFLICTSDLFSQQVCYINSGNQIFQLDINTCSTQLIGTSNTPLTDIALTPSGDLYGIDFYNFYHVNTTNGVPAHISIIGTSGSGFNSLVGFNDDYVLAVRTNSGLYKIHTSTGDTTFIGFLGYYPAGDITSYRGSYYMADAMNQLIRFKLDFENNAISSIEVVGKMNTSENAVFGIVTVGDANCEKNDLQLLAFEGITIYNVNPSTANCSVLCPSSSGIGAYGAAASAETHEQIFDAEVEIPNIFTPNNDGINDYFEPTLLIEVSHLQIDILNRWGNSVYSSDSNDSFKWDGSTHTNELCPDGVYFYQLVYSDYCNKQAMITGFVQLEK